MAVEKVGKTWRYRIRKKKKGKIIFEDSQSGFRTKREAELAEKKAVIDFENNEHIKKGNVPFAEYFKNWINLYKMGTGSLKTDHTRHAIIKKANAIFGDMVLKDISKDDYQKIINELGALLTKETMRKYHSYFKACLEHAVDERILKFNPAKNITLRFNDKKTKLATDKYLDYGDAIKLKKTLLERYDVSSISKTVCLIALETGMRFGEILALTWDRINFNDRTITIDRSWDYVYKTGFIPTKTRNTRTIAISKFLINLLQNIKKEQLDNQFVLAKRRENIITNRAVNCVLKAACAKAKIKQITVHALRHTHGSVLLYKGFSILYISKRLGHANVSITQNVYLHLLSEAQNEYDNEIKINFEI